MWIGRRFSVLVLALCSVAIFSSDVQSQEYGRFSGDAQGQWIQRTSGNVFQLSNDFSFTDVNGVVWSVPSGEITDGASIPSWAKWIIGGNFDGPYLYGAIIHYYYCCSKTRDYNDTHRVFYRGMRAAGVPYIMANAMYAAVAVAGPKRWNTDPKGIVHTPCGEPEIAQPRTLFAELDDRKRRLVIAKVMGMTRTLAATSGQALDVVEGRVIVFGSEEAAAHLGFLNLAAEKGFDGGVEKFGLFSPIDELELKFETSKNQPISWRPGQIPELDAFLEKGSLTYPNPTFLGDKEYFPIVARSIDDVSIDRIPQSLVDAPF